MARAQWWSLLLLATGTGPSIGQLSLKEQKGGKEGPREEREREREYVRVAGIWATCSHNFLGMQALVNL